MGRKHDGTVVYIDTETAGLRFADRPWEVGMVRVQQDGTTTHHLFHVADFQPRHADPTALDLGGFYQRHPAHLALNDPARQIEPGMDSWGLVGAAADVPIDYMSSYEFAVARRVELLTRDALIVGANITYDAPRVEAMLDRAGLAWARHYRTCDVYDLATGALGLRPPATSADLATMLGVDREKYGNAHNALVDALYARDLADAAHAHAQAAGAR